MRLFLRYFFIIFTFISVVIFTGIYFLGKYIYMDVIEEKRNQLKEYVKLISDLFPEKSDYSYENREIKKIATDLNIRITVINKDGKVIYDSTFYNHQDLHNIENHLTREEVQIALKTGEGYSSRLSTTVKIKHLYYAKLINDNFILRVSFPYKTVENYIFKYEHNIIIFFIGIISLIAILSFYFAKKLSLPVESLNEIINKVESKELIDINKYNTHFDDISSLLHRFYKVMIEREQALYDEKQKLNSILSTLSDAVALMDNRWNILYKNKKFTDLFSESLTNLTNDIKEYETLKTLNEITKNNDGTFFIKYKSRFYEVTLKSFENYKLIVLHDTSEQMHYHTFKSELIANISHELKTPISIIMGYAETLMAEDIDEKTRLKFAQKLYEASTRLDTLIADIINLHILENTDKNFIVRNPVNSQELIIELQDIYKESTKKLHFDFANIEVFILKEHLQSIFKNLIDNALNYSTGANVYVSLKKDNDKVELEVSDEGPLIQDQEKQKIFERFYTSSKSRNKKSSGTGLGLSIVKHTAEIYKGYVELLSNRYGGNTFKVVLKEKII
ncbi:MAG: GHKL domain-containing protein [Deferribacterales bacterium]